MVSSVLSVLEVNKNMKTITDINEANSLMKLYVGSKVKVFLYTASLKRLALRIELPKNNKILYLVAVGCEYMNGPFSFTSSILTLSSELNTDKEEITKIVDKENKFELISSGGFSLVQGAESEFSTLEPPFFTVKE